MDFDIKQDIKCKNCGSVFQGQYCNNCGQKVIKRFTASFLWQGFHKDLFEVDNGLLLTYRDLWIRPGEMVLDYVQGSTKKYYSPLKYLVFWTALYLILQPVIMRGSEDLVKEHSIADLILNSHRPFSKDAFSDFNSFWFQFISLHTNYYFFTLIPFVAVVSYFLNRRCQFNVTEIIIVYTYFFGHFASLLLLIIFIAPSSNSGSEFLTSTIAMVVFFIPYFYLFFKFQKGFFKENWGVTILKGLGSLYGGMAIYLALLFLIFNTIKFFI